MKKIYTILVCMCMLAGFVACEKDKEFVLTTLTVTNETVTPSYETAEVSCSFKADATISEAYVQYSLSSGFAKYDVAKMTEEKGMYMAQLTDLVDNTTYYIRYAVSNKYSSVVTEEVVECQTLPCTVPTIVLDSIGEVRESHAKAYLHLTFDGGASVTDIGICWSKQANPTIEDIHKSTKDTVAVLDITDLQENTKYYVRAYAVNKVGTAYSEELVFTTESVLSEPTGTENGYGYVDLGLSVKWATMNVGANNPEEYGDYFAWGETEPKDSYYWTTYKYSNGSETTLTKYNTSTMAGTVDNKTTLELSDDAAYINWDGNWRMPSEAEWEELRKQCTWTWTTKNGVKGHKVTSKINDNNIFLPASGRHFVDALTGVGVDGNYWSNTLNVASPCEAMYVLFISNGASSFGSDRYVGHSVRPVLGEKVVELTPPIVATTVATQITATTAVTGGNVTNDGGAEVTERGVCIATISNPTTANTKILAGSGTGEFTCDITGLQEGTKYYVRAYAINSVGIAYGEEVNFMTVEEIVDNPPSNLVAMPFSVSANKQVYFSKGNLQYHPANNEWRFAESQLDYIGDANKNISSTYNGWLDLFGWSTNTTNFGVSTSKNSNDYSGSFQDWGQIQIGTDTPNTWSTLTLSEWEYVLNYRANADMLCGIAQVNGVNGLILLPDNWINPDGITFKYSFHSNSGASYYADFQMFTSIQWSKMESLGAVFLPAAGERAGEDVGIMQHSGYYWSSSEKYSYSAFAFRFFSEQWSTFGCERYIGNSVRLVKDSYGKEGGDLPSAYTNSITQITETTAMASGNVTNDGGSNVTERGVVYATTQNPTITNTKVTSGTGTGSFTCNLTGLQPNTTYYVRAYAENSKGTAYGEEVSFTTKEVSISDPTGTENGYAYVDLGLPSGTKWATMNVGATQSEDYGDHFAWGETEPKEYYEWSTYKWCDGTYNSLTKYNVHSSYGIVDDKTQLELLDDAANVNWGANWRLPTDEEWTELREQCVWKWRTWNGVKGYIVTGNNSKSIFLPAAGYKDGYDYWDQSYYWSCSLDDLNVYNALSVHISADYVQRITENRNYGFTVRPVLGETIAEITIPTIATSVVTQITKTTAVAGGNVTSDGGATVTERGVVYSTNPNPVITNLNNTIRPCGSGTGEFTYTITGLQPSTTYYIRAYAKNDAGTAYGEEVTFATKANVNISDPTGTENGYGYVDLGLSVKWATMNVGATKPEEYGDYFAWGETELKNEYSWSNYKYCYSYYNNLTKYNTYSSYGTVDNKTTLELGDDAAHANWGSSWRMPNEAELSELCEQCTWTWTTQNGVNGYKVTSKSNGNNIFLPAAGYRTDSKLNAVGSDGCYWANSISSTLPYCAWRLNFNTSEVTWNGDNRYYGQSVRPVCP